MAKIRKEYEGVFGFKCEGCGEMHGFFSKDAPSKCKPQWEFNDDLDNPTISPSLLYKTGHYLTGQKQPPDCRHCKEDADMGTCTVCHSFIKNGNIQYLNDCTHKLAGQTIPLPELD